MRTTIFLLAFLFCAALPGQSIFDSTRVRQSTEVFFASGKFDLSTEANRAIDSVSNFYKSQSLSVSVKITAHTDSVGSAEMNRRLSENRAAAVRAALVAREIPAEKVVVTAFGEKRPAAANASEEGRQRNRRATLDVVLAVPMETLSGKIRDGETGRGVAATVIFSTKTRRDSLQTDTSGRYTVRVPRDSVVKVDAYAPNYFFEGFVAKIYGTKDMAKRAKEAPKEIVLQPARAGEKMTLRHLFFVGNEAILLKTSEPELPKILKFMQINPNLKIEVAGHINYPNALPEKVPKADFRLSERRAELVYNYLISNGISRERVTWKGYGNTQMLFPKARAEEEQAQNRRVEIRVISD